MSYGVQFLGRSIAQTLYRARAPRSGTALDHQPVTLFPNTLWYLVRQPDSSRPAVKYEHTVVLTFPDKREDEKNKLRVFL